MEEQEEQEHTKKSCKLSSFFYSLNMFGKSNLTHWTTDVMFSGQPFAILTMFFLLWQERGSILHLKCLKNINKCLNFSHKKTLSTLSEIPPTTCLIHFFERETLLLQISDMGNKTLSVLAHKFLLP